jgi:Tfp pilus assembly protein PilX
MDDLVPVLVVVVSTAGAVLAARIAASAQRSSNKMRASLDAATAQNAAQAALYDGYGDLSAATTAPVWATSTLSW